VGSLPSRAYEYLEPVRDASAGIVARKAAARGLRAQAWVDTTPAPGSKVVTRYL
jgi:aconitase A